MLRFLKYKPEDFPDYYFLVSDDQVMKYITGKGLSEKEAGEKFTSIMQVNEEDDVLGYFKIVDEEMGFIGECKLVWYKYDRSLLEIGYLLKQDFWGKGLGTAICERLLKLAKEVAPQRDIIGIIHPDNVASKRLLEKSGFKSFSVGIEDDMPTEKLILRK